MTPAEAHRLIAMLTAAYRTHLEPGELAQYVTYIAELERADVAEETIALLIRNEPRFPRISEIRELYLTTLKQRPDSALEEPQLTAEQIATNLEWARMLTKRMEGHMNERQARWQKLEKREIPAHVWTDNPMTWPDPVPEVVVPKEPA